MSRVQYYTAFHTGSVECLTDSTCAHAVLYRVTVNKSGQLVHKHDR